jgi:hypothetical protein
MQNQSDILKILLTEMAELECTHQGCTAGVGGAVWKTKALEAAIALELLSSTEQKPMVTPAVKNDYVLFV